jgi:hypothetical protein
MKQKMTLRMSALLILESESSTTERVETFGRKEQPRRESGYKY